MRKLTLLRTVLSFTGVTPVRWWRLPVGLYCFNYHRLGQPESTEFNRNIFSCTAKRFEEHVVLLKERFEILNLDRVSFLARHGYSGRKPLALITFDDGYIDNYSIAFPILRKHDASAVFFLPTAFIGSASLPWWEEIHWLLHQAVGRSIRLEGADEPFLLQSEDDERSVRRVANFVKSRRIPMDQQLEEIRQACSDLRPPEQRDGFRLFLDWDQVKQMHSQGMDFGSHTHTHRLLAHLGPAEQQEELARSKEVLEAALGEPVTSVAYPIGSRTAYTQQTCELAESLGYRLGFNFLRQTNPFPLAQPLNLNRFAVGGDMCCQALQSLACFPSLFAE